MKYVLIPLSFVCWLLISLTIIGIIITPFSYFSGESDLSEIISVLIMGPLSIAFFYWLGPNRYKKYKLKKIEELAGRQGVGVPQKPTTTQRPTKFSSEYEQDKEIKLKQEKYIEEQKTLLKNSYKNNEHKIICETINTLDNYFFRRPEEGGYLESYNFSNESIENLLETGEEWLQLKNSPSKMPDDEIWESCFIRNEVCIGMPIEYVEKLLILVDAKWETDSKKIENSKGTTLIRRYGKYKNQVGSYSYKYEVKYRDNKVISYKEL